LNNLKKEFRFETLAPSAASIAGKIQYVRVRHPNANYVRMEHFLLNRTTFLFNKNIVLPDAAAHRGRFKNTTPLSR
jgi:hypothetical protein